jgi:hypothetical protein
MVTTHESTGGAEFHLTWNTDGWWVTFPRMGSLSTREMDFDELRHRRFIRLVWLSRGSYRGWPTQSGIEAVRAWTATQANQQADTEASAQNSSGKNLEVGSTSSPNDGNLEVEVERRKRLLADYKAVTGNPSNIKIYSARNSGIHKPEFYSWVNGELSSKSATALNFERFLREKKAPIPRHETA